MTMRAAYFLLSVALTAAVAEAAPANRYHLPGDFEGAIDQDGARQAVKRGDAAPFAKIFAKVGPQIHGEIVGQKLEQHRGVWVYEFRVVAPDGHVQFLHFDAKTGRPYQVKPLS